MYSLALQQSQSPFQGELGLGQNVHVFLFLSYNWVYLDPSFLPDLFPN